ncbi:MAG: putative metal-binding motif-containing protein [Deltaproteobacteria bacterium]|nr:putative metal-binding motif-containing protein [Deltaproteobacteria bacterium]
MRALWFLALVGGCGPSDAVLCDEDTLWYLDLDGDGYGTDASARTDCEPHSGWARRGGDCDDEDWEINPGAPEPCDGLDNDCSGAADDAGGAVGTPRPLYLDQDGDGYGEQEVAMEWGCVLRGYTDRSGDCDDLDPARSPAAAEICDGVDQDCDGAVDDGLGDAPVSLWADEDHDGYGTGEAERVYACLLPGYVGQGGDCDDADRSRHPGAAEVCDEVDHDCDGALDDVIWYLDLDGDGFGGVLQVWVGCELPLGPLAVGLPGDCDDLDPLTHPRAAEVCDGNDRDCDGTLWEGAAVYHHAWHVDGDGDGLGAARSAESRSCAPPAPGGSVLATDCDDSDPAVGWRSREVESGYSTNSNSAYTEYVSTWWIDGTGHFVGGERVENDYGAVTRSEYVFGRYDCATDYDRWTSSPTGTQSFDEDCNLTLRRASSTTLRNTYDQEGRIVASVSTGTSSSWTQWWTWDALDHELSWGKDTDGDGAPEQWREAEWDGAHLLYRAADDGHRLEEESCTWTAVSSRCEQAVNGALTAVVETGHDDAGNVLWQGTDEGADGSWEAQSWWVSDGAGTTRLDRLQEDGGALAVAVWGGQAEGVEATATWSYDADGTPVSLAVEVPESGLSALIPVVDDRGRGATLSWGASSLSGQREGGSAWSRPNGTGTPSASSGYYADGSLRWELDGGYWDEDYEVWTATVSWYYPGGLYRGHSDEDEAAPRLEALGAGGTVHSTGSSWSTGDCCCCSASSWHEERWSCHL